MVPKTLVLTSAVIESMVFNPRIQQEFVFLRHAQSQWLRPGPIRVGMSGGCCGKNRERLQQNRVHLEGLVRNSVAVLPPEQLKRLKELLNVDRLLVPLNNGHGGIIHKTI